jgi:hypothetical protein
VPPATVPVKEFQLNAMVDASEDAKLNVGADKVDGKVSIKAPDKFISE